VSQPAVVDAVACDNAERASFSLDGAQLVPVDAIRPNRFRPRQLLDERALDALAASIRRWGQLQPIVVRSVGAGYELICGERRWRAHLRAGLEFIWAVERGASDSDALILALVENFHRADLSHTEKVAAVDQLAELVSSRGLRRTAGQLQVDPSWLSRQLAVRRDPVIFPALEAGQLSFGQAAELLRAPAQERQALLERTVALTPHVSTAMIRAWVAEARQRCSDQSPIGSRAHTKREPDTCKSFDDVLRDLAALGEPRTLGDRIALERLIGCARQLLSRANAPGAGHEKSVWAELRCLMCGELAGVIENGRCLRPVSGDSVQRNGSHVACGRCGGSLVSGARGVSYMY
jgi:ParB family chromosome partitioning protein